MRVIQSFSKGAAASDLHVRGCDINPEMTAAWLNRVFGVDTVEILHRIAPFAMRNTNIDWQTPER